MKQAYIISRGAEEFAAAREQFALKAQEQTRNHLSRMASHDFRKAA